MAPASEFRSRTRGHYVVLGIFYRYIIMYILCDIRCTEDRVLATLGQCAGNQHVATVVTGLRPGKIICDNCN